MVIKPDNLGQSKGVFAVEFDDEGDNLEFFANSKVSQIQQQQIYKINLGESKQNIGKILRYLLFCESLKEQNIVNDNLYADFEESYIDQQIGNLYNSKILIQPFIEGVLQGDIRVNLANIDGQFKVLGAIFRKAHSKIMIILQLVSLLIMLMQLLSRNN